MKGGMSFMESLRWKPKGETNEERRSREAYAAQLKQEENAKQQELNEIAKEFGGYKAVDILRINVDNDGYYIEDKKTFAKKRIDGPIDETTKKLIVRDIRTPRDEHLLPIIGNDVLNSQGRPMAKPGMYGRNVGYKYGTIRYEKLDAEDALRALKEKIQKPLSNQYEQKVRANLAKAPEHLSGFVGNLSKGVRGLFSGRAAPAAGGRRTRKHRSTKRRSRKNRR